MNKENLKNRLLELQRRAIRELSEKISTTNSMVDLDETDTIDPEDLSHQVESSVTENLFKHQLQKARLDLDLLDHIDFSKKVKVEPGAFVQTEKFNFIVACATTPFNHEGKHIIGISIESPIFKKMKNREEGESFTISDNSYTILSIH